MNLFTTDEEIKAIHPVTSNFSLKTLEPYLDQATEEYLIPVLSQDQYDDLLAAYHASVAETPVALDQADIDLLFRARKALAPIALVMAMSNLDVIVDQSGIRRSENENHKTAYQYQRNDWKWDQLRLGLHNLDVLHRFLVKNIDDYTLFAASDEYATQQKLFIRNVKEFDLHFNINKSYWVFRQLLPIMADVELFQIKPLIGATLFDTLKTESKDDGTFTENHAAIFEMVKKAVAHLTIARAISKLPLRIDHQGITIVNTENSKSIDVKVAANKQQLEDLKEQATRDGHLYLDEINKLLPTEEEETPTEETDETGNFLAL